MQQASARFSPGENRCVGVAFRTFAPELPDDAWQFPVRILDSPRLPAAQLLNRRLVEAELHHCDLGTGYGPADWPASFATMKPAEPMQSLRQDRLNPVQQA
jgi:maleylpyruvate isomerase